MPDIRNEKTDAAVKAALLNLLAEKPLGDIGMAELARKANVSRSTLYTHYDNVNDVFKELVMDFIADVRGLRTQLKCSECRASSEKRPFCQAVRAAGPYQPLVLARDFLPTYLNAMLNGPYLDEVLNPFLDAGATPEQARALFVFQMTGCYTAATTLDSMLWEDNQRAIDQFIRGGFAALKTM